MTIRGLLAISLLLSLPPALAVADKETRLEIVDRAIAHHGGEIYDRSQTSLRVCSRGGCFDLTVKMQDGLYDYTAEGMVRESLRRVRITNDAAEWYEDGSAQSFEPEREQRLRDWVMARVYFPFLPYRLNDPGVYKEDLGLVAWGDRTLHKVKVTFEPGISTDASDEYMYWFDPDSGQLEMFAYSYKGDPGGLRFRRAYDHRRIGGILFFDQENLGLDAPGLRVDMITPEMVETRMGKISNVELSNVEVVPN